MQDMPEVPTSEFHAHHARCFATTCADRQLNDAGAERYLRVEGAERRARSVVVRHVAQVWRFLFDLPARLHDRPLRTSVEH